MKIHSGRWGEERTGKDERLGLEAFLTRIRLQLLRAVDFNWILVGSHHSERINAGVEGYYKGGIKCAVGLVKLEFIW